MLTNVTISIYVLIGSNKDPSMQMLLALLDLNFILRPNMSFWNIGLYFINK